MSMYMNGRYFKITHPPRSFFVEGNPVTFKTKYKLPIKSLKINFEPVQEGEGDPSPENVRPITGWNGVSVQRTGINVWNEEWEVGAISSSTGNNINNNTIIRSKNYIPVVPEMTYYLNVSKNLGVARYGKNKNFVSLTQGIAKTTLKIPSGIYYIRFYVNPAYGAIYNHDLSINYPASATSYEPYIGSTTPISWSSSAGTVYGGTLAWEKNGSVTLTKTMESVDMGTLTWARVAGSSGNYMFKAPLPDSKTSKSTTGLRNATCDRYALASSGGVIYTGEADKAFIINSTYLGIQGNIYIHDTAYTDAATFKSAMSGVQLVYELATPQTYTLTPTEALTLLQGTNTIWSDTNGNLEVTYESYTNEQ